MRLWSIHPQYLDSMRLVCCWKDALLAYDILSGSLKKFEDHYQLKRFRECKNPILAIKLYIFYIYTEGKNRGFSFDITKLKKINFTEGALEEVCMPVGSGQINFEMYHLKEKLKKRKNQKKLEEVTAIKIAKTHPCFFRVDGEIEKWEKAHESYLE